MKGLRFMADYSPAVRFSPHASGLPLPSGLSTTFGATLQTAKINIAFG